MPKNLNDRVPSLKTLLAFEVAARCGRFSVAAKELNVTQPAVSRLVANLEAHLDVGLLSRTPSGLKLTEPGVVLYRAVSEGFDGIHTAVSEITRYRAGKHMVTLSLPTAVATHWLLPKLSQLYSLFPDVDLKFQLNESATPQALLDADIRIQLLEKDSVDQRAEFLVEEKIHAVCSPSYLANYGALDHKNADHTFLHLNAPLYSWQQFLDDIQVEHSKHARFITFSDYSLAVQAAKNGQGVALGWNMAVSDGLNTGELVSASPISPATGRSYFLIREKGRKLGSVVQAVKNWLVQQIQAEVL